MPGVCPELEVERSVRERLYGDRGEIRAIARPRLPLAAGGLPAGRLFGGRYRLVERVGAGGMATVYRARDERLKRDVAVKVIAEWVANDPLFVGRFRREAELCARLAHQNIVAILDAGVEPQDFIVMEFVNGTDAARMVHSRGPLTPDETVHVLAQICDALAYAHDQDVLHQDVSPGNILIRHSDGAAKLADFGLASHAVDVPARPVTKIMGTPGYVAPEVLRGAGPSPRSDLYSLGAVAYRLLAGPLQVHPADPRATAPLATAVPRMPPLAEARPDLPACVNDAVQRALENEPGGRQVSVAEFRAQLVGGQSTRVGGELASAA